MKNYEINSETLALIPISENATKVMETDVEYKVINSSKKIIDNSCRYFGSSYQGRFEGTKEMLGINYKAPIIIEETKPLIFFPTNSPRGENCSWICLNNIEKYYKKDPYTTCIVFKNGKILLINMSYASFDLQILRASRLDLILRERKLI